MQTNDLILNYFSTRGSLYTCIVFVFIFSVGTIAKCGVKPTQHMVHYFLEKSTNQTIFYQFPKRYSW